MSMLAEAVSSSSSLIETILFYVFALMTGVSAIAVAVGRNIVRMAVSLLFTLAGVAGLYFLLHAEFLAAVQLVVYAGGTLILIVFGIMLTNRMAFQLYHLRRGEMTIAVVLALVLFATIAAGIVTRFGRVEPKELEASAYPVYGLGQALLGDYLVPFEIASVVLLVVMIGAAYLAKSRKRGGSAS
jgi:NADH:ubiquinone oxidoreductase subunit 6 (subunit J)